MCCNVHHIPFRLPVILWVMMIASSYAHTALSSGLASMFQKEAAPYTDIQWPVVINDSRETLGLYGGVTTAYNHRGNQESAILVILPSGYMVPVLGNGDVATFPESYFSEENCAGHEYLPVSSSFPGLLPMRGMVYRSVLSNALVYIPRYKERSRIQAGSRVFLDHDGTRVCRPSSSQPHVLQVMHNAPETTGLHNETDFPLAVVAIDSLTVRSVAMKRLLVSRQTAAPSLQIPRMLQALNSKSVHPAALPMRWATDIATLNATWSPVSMTRVTVTRLILWSCSECLRICVHPDVFLQMSATVFAILHVTFRPAGLMMETVNCNSATHAGRHLDG